MGVGYFACVWADEYFERVCCVLVFVCWVLGAGSVLYG